MPAELGLLPGWREKTVGGGFMRSFWETRFAIRCVYHPSLACPGTVDEGWNGRGNRLY